jgi:glyoxylase-like metal-dependent hydrolase (beta-lactamase superfamily II)
LKIINLGNIVANNYLVSSNDKYLLIDTGYENDFKRFCKNMKQKNINLSQIDYIFLTHAHDDHAGFLNELLHHTSAKIILHPLAIERLREGKHLFIGGCSTKKALLFCKAMALAGKGDHIFPVIEKQFEERYITTDSGTIRDFEKIFSAKIIETPGHTSCSISVLLNNEYLFCGDAAMNGFPSSMRATIWISDLNQFCKSWETIISLNSKIMYPGHGKPFSPNDLTKYLDEVRNFRSYPLN